MLPAGIAAIAIASLASSYFVSGFGAHLLRNEALAQMVVVEAEAEHATLELEEALDDAGPEREQADALAAVVVEGYGTPELAESLHAASADILRLTDAADPSLPAAITLDESDLRPVWVSAAEAFEALERIEDLKSTGTRNAVAADELEEATRATTDARAAVYAAASATAGEALAAHTFATYEARIAVQHAIDQEGDGWSNAENSAGAYTALTAAVSSLQQAHAAEEARRADPAYPAWADIEAFARSIAHGVTFDFVWAYTVNGMSSDEWYSGTALYRFDDGGWATIELSHSISDAWHDDINAKAVVVHEVGHAQVVRDECYPIFSGSTFNSDDEMWATAWAIASGYDVPGSGIELYGRPTDAQIAEAGKCT